MAGATLIPLAFYLLLPNRESWMAVAASKRVRDVSRGTQVPSRVAREGRQLFPDPGRSPLGLDHAV